MDSIDVIERCRTCTSCVADPTITSILFMKCGHPAHFNSVIGEACNNAWMGTCQDYINKEEYDPTRSSSGHEWALSVPISIEKLENISMPKSMVDHLVHQLVISTSSLVDRKTCYPVEAVIAAANSYPGAFQWLVNTNYLVPVRPTRFGNYYMIPVSFFEREVVFHCHGSVAPGYNCSEPGDQSGVYLKIRNIDKR